MKTSIVWFKNNLRLHDNQPLVEAIATSQQIIPVYCFNSLHFAKTAYGFNKTGNFRAQFLLETLDNLNENLVKLGSGLMIVYGEPATELAKLAVTYNAQTVFASEEIAYEELHTQSLVAQALAKVNCELKTHVTSTLYNFSSLPYTKESLPNVFTIFRKHVETTVAVTPCINQPTIIHSPTLPALVLPSIQQLGLNETATDARAAITFKGGETAGLQRLQQYFFDTNNILNYKTTRNQLVGEAYSSKFSAWLAMGCLSPKFIYHQLKLFEQTVTANDSTYWLFFELLWREYFSLMMYKYGKLFFLKNGIQTTQKNATITNHALLNNWINGTTGEDFVDANMIELKLTGFMSNRGRQIVASYLVNNLQLDWRLGAAYFEQQLIDYDVCSNWCNWAYLAGVGNDPRGSRVFNIAKQAKDYDANFSYRKLWLQK